MKSASRNGSWPARSPRTRAVQDCSCVLFLGLLQRADRSAAQRTLTAMTIMPPSRLNSGTPQAAATNRVPSDSITPPLRATVLRKEPRQVHGAVESRRRERRTERRTRWSTRASTTTRALEVVGAAHRGTTKLGCLRPLTHLSDGPALLSGSVCPHCDTEAGRRSSYRAAVASRALPAGWAIEDGVGARFTDGLLTDSVTRTPRACPYRLEPGKDGGVHEQAMQCRLLPAGQQPTLG